MASNDRYWCFASFWAAMLLPLGGCSDRPSPQPSEGRHDPAAEAPSENVLLRASESVSSIEVSDDRAILGSWQSTFFEQDGKPDPTGAGVKFVFTEKSMSTDGVPNWYHLDPGRNPKHLDFNIEGLETPHAAIYRLDGDTLSICFATTAGKARPSRFETTLDDGYQLVKCKRTATLSDQPVRDDLDPSLRNAINDAIVLLERNEIEKYLERFVPPDELRALKQSQWKETVEYVGSERAAFLNTFKVLSKLKPTMNNVNTEAVFDLRAVHIEGGVSFPQIRFIKTNGEWYLADR